jgi:hypothetical protein
LSASFINFQGRNGEITVTAGFLGELTTGTYRNSSTGDNAALLRVFVEEANLEWWASDLPIFFYGPVGNYEIRLTSVRAVSVDSVGTSYEVHGTLDATLLPPILATEATGTVTMHMTF